MERIVLVVKNILQTKIQMSEKLNNIDCAVCGKKTSTFIKNKETQNSD